MFVLSTFHQHRAFWKIIGREIRQYRRSLVMGLGSISLLALTDLLKPWPLKIIFDNILLDRELPEWLSGLAVFIEADKQQVVIGLSSVIVALASIRGLLAYLETYHTTMLGNRIAHALRIALFGHLQRLSLNFHSQKSTGAVMTKVAGDTSKVRSFFSDTVVQLGAHALTIVTTFAVMFLMNWRLAAIVSLTFPLLILNVFFLHRRSLASERRQRHREDRIASRLSEVLGSVHLIQAFGRERHEELRFANENGEYLDESMRNARIESTADRAVEITTALGTSAVVLFGSLQVLRGNMTPGGILVFSSYLHALYRPIRRTVKLTLRLSQVQVAISRLSDLLSVNQQISSKPDAIKPRHIRGDIAFSNVCFAYDISADTNVLKHLQFEIKAGQRVAVVGASGAGKTTLIGLILRLYDPRTGCITIDGVDLRDYDVELIRNQIACVLQDSILSGATIHENIAYGNLSAKREDVVAAARLAHADSFIQGLPAGYDTVVGERGARLSGGQQRRIAIARALIRQAPILIMDEPMTGLDAKSELQIDDALQRVLRDKTCITITHDVASTAHADLVIVMEDGEVREIGPPTELRRQHGAYWAMTQQANRASNGAATGCSLQKQVASPA